MGRHITVTVMQTCQVLVLMVPNYLNGIFDVNLASIGSFVLQKGEALWFQGPLVEVCSTQNYRQRKLEKSHYSRSPDALLLLFRPHDFPHPTRLDLGSTARIEKHATHALQRFASINERLRVKAHALLTFVADS